MFRRTCVVLLLTAGIVSGSAQTGPRLAVRTEIRPESLSAGGSAKLVLTLDIPQNIHVSDAASGLFSVSSKDPDVRFGDIDYPKGVTDEWGSIYRGRIRIQIPVRIAPSTEQGIKTVPFEIDYQPCDEVNDICLAPMTQTETFELRVLPAGETASGFPHPEQDRSLSGRLTRALEKGSVLAFLLVFVGGLLTSLTPCVYPMIPITIAVIGTQAAGGKMKGFVLSLFYVLGISITFSALGILAATTGSLFGSVTQHPAVQGVIAGIFFLMGLSMLGAFTVQLPAGLRMKIQTRKRSGFIGALLTGVVAGVIVSPCVSPLLVVILTWVAKTGSVALGFGLLFAFAWGIGVLFIVLGTFSGVLKNAPRGGGWTEYIERAFGLILLVLALVFLRPLIAPFFYRSVWAVFLVVVGAFIGGFTPLPDPAPVRRKIGKAAGFLLILTGSALLVAGLVEQAGFPLSLPPSATETEKEALWLRDTEEAFRRAAVRNRPVLIDFYAEWCAACRELDEKTWNDPRVRALLGRVVPVKLDLTESSARTRTIQKAHGIVGMPTVILYDSQRNELARFTGFQSPEEVMEILNQVLEVQTS